MNGRQSSSVMQRGVTLIELMIGMVLGLATTIVISQVMTASEQARRGTTSGSDAQVNGAVALYSLQREIMNAGYGMSDRRDAFGCAINAQYGGTVFPFVFEPLRIADGGAAGESDALTINASNKFGFSAPLLANPNKLDDSQFTVSTIVGVDGGDVVVALPKTLGAQPCSLFVLTSTVGTNAIRHDRGDPAIPSDWNHAPGSGVVPLYDEGATLVNMGSASFRTYTVGAKQTLTENAFDTTSGTLGIANDLFPNVVNLQAFYGKDTNNDDIVDVYNTQQPANGGEWRQVRTVRIVLVARTDQWQKDGGTASQPVVKLGSAPTVAGSGVVPCGTEQCLTLKVDHLADWRQYRYQVFDTIVPLRNLVWNR